MNEECLNCLDDHELAFAMTGELALDQDQLTRLRASLADQDCPACQKVG